MATYTLEVYGDGLTLRHIVTVKGRIEDVRAEARRVILGDWSVVEVHAYRNGNRLGGAHYDVETRMVMWISASDSLIGRQIRADGTLGVGLL